MSIFDVITLFGGLAMFLYGMRLMGDSLKESSSGTLKNLLEKVTNNHFKAFLLGVAVTAIIQSSTATIVITSGLVAAGILSLNQSLGIIIGANVGTTVTGQIIRLLDLNASSGSILQFFQPSTLAPLSLIIGIVLIMSSKFKNSKSIGNIAIGFGILFSGLLNMTKAVSAIQDSEIVVGLLSNMNNNPIIGYLVGAGIAFVLQSSSAAIGILQAFSASGLLVFSSIYAVIVGIYLGDCVTTAIVCSIGASADAKRVGIVNILFNIVKSIFALLLVNIVHQLGLIDNLWASSVNSGIIANTNTIFNLACSIFAFPFLTLLEKISYRVVKDDIEDDKNKYSDKIEGLSPVFYDTPALALRSCYDLLLIIYKEAKANVQKSLTLFKSYNTKLINEINETEDEIDYLKDQVSKYIVELLPHISDDYHVSILDQYHKMTSEFEHLGDIAIYIREVADALHIQNTKMSSRAIKELDILCNLVNEVLDETEKAFEKRDIEAAYRIEPLTLVVDDVINSLKSSHLKRMGTGECDVFSDTHYMNLLSNIKRAMDICSNIGFATVLRVKPELANKEHDYFANLHKGNDDIFNKIYDDTREQYFNKLAQISS